ncbi:MAG TPA: hypothetical protein PKK48_05905 [Phycisphaerae bacterium]|nr:hypothetical protein [Phycisphaerae bacterium]HPS52052.1 hypothetical protein [Phycisphaerae bacterium]
MKKAIVAVFLGGLIFAGCDKPVEIEFQKPTGTKMVTMGHEYTWPAKITFQRSDDVNQIKDYDVKLTIPSNQGMIEASGKISFYPFKATDEATLTTYMFSFSAKDLERLYNGEVITVKADNADDQLMYKMILGTGKNK